jgi:hypothetical protein
LGIVSNCAHEHTGSYGKKYYKKYHGKYERSYARAFKKSKNAAAFEAESKEAAGSEDNA